MEKHKCQLGSNWSKIHTGPYKVGLESFLYSEENTKANIHQTGLKYTLVLTLLV